MLLVKDAVYLDLHKSSQPRKARTAPQLRRDSRTHHLQDLNLSRRRAGATVSNPASTAAEATSLTSGSASIVSPWLGCLSGISAIVPFCATETNYLA